MTPKTKRALLITLGALVLIALTSSAYWVQRFHLSEQEREMLGAWYFEPERAEEGLLLILAEKHEATFRDFNKFRNGSLRANTETCRWHREGMSIELEIEPIFGPKSWRERLEALVTKGRWLRDVDTVTMEIEKLDQTDMNFHLSNDSSSKSMRAVRVPPDFVPPQLPATLPIPTP